MKIKYKQDSNRSKQNSKNPKQECRITKFNEQLDVLNGHYLFVLSSFFYTQNDYTKVQSKKDKPIQQQ